MRREKTAMDDQSPELNAAIRAIQGADDLNAILPMIGDREMARVVALAPDAHPIVRAVAALAGELTALLDTRMIADPALHAVMVRLIGHPKGLRALDSWADMAPVGSGRAHAQTIINNAAQMGWRGLFVAAALIGPCDESADLLLTSGCAASAIRRWGQATPDRPTAWMPALSAEARDRLIDAVSGNPYDVARCLPWLPEETANWAAFDEVFLKAALAAFAEASPTARARHATLVQRLVAQATSRHLVALTRLACAMHSKAVWRRVETLIRSSPSNARIADIAAHWDDLDARVRDAILTCAKKKSDICAAIAAAQGQRDAMAMHISGTTATAFFAALKPDVWDALGSDVQRQWRDALPTDAAHRAVRSLGPRPEFLAQAILDNNLVRAVQRHTCDDATLHWALLPVALRDLPLNTAHALIADLPTPPPDPSAFFCVASGWRGEPDVIPSIRDALRRTARLAQVIAIQRTAECRMSFRAGYEALRHALQGWTWDDLKTIAPILDDDARTAITLDCDALIERLAHPDRKEAMRQALARLASLPPDIAVPSQIALHRWGTGNDTRRKAQEAAEAIADALRDHGDVFLAIVDALGDERLRAALLPLPKDAATAKALRDLTRNDLPSARRLAHALRGQKWHTALHALLTAPPHAADAVWRSIDDAERSAIIAGVGAAPFGIDPIVHSNPIIALALVAVQSDNADLRDAGIAAAAAQHAIIRANWDSLHPETQRVLIMHQWFADLPTPSPQPAIKRARLR